LSRHTARFSLDYQVLHLAYQRLFQSTKGLRQEALPCEAFKG